MGSGGSKPTEEQLKEVKVLVVGGGYGGACCAAELQKSGVPFLVVDPKEFFYHNVAALRAAVYPEYSKVTAIPLKKTFGGSFRQASVVAIDLGEKIARLDDGTEVRFTHLVLATGSEGDYPARTESKTVEELEAENGSVAADIESSSSVVIIGGGAVGVELAGEIVHKHRDKKVTVLNSGKSLLSNVRLGEKLQDSAKSALEAKGVEVRLEERVSNLGELTFDKLKKQTVKTDKGSYDADMVFKCIGLRRPCTEMLKNTFGSSAMDERHQIKVTPEMKVEGFDNVYAIGDCCGFEQEKMAAHAQDQGSVVCQNILRGIVGEEPKQYTPRFTGMIVPIGKGGGVGVYNGWCVPSIAVYYIKSKGLFSDMFWKAMGQEMPDVNVG